MDPDPVDPDNPIGCIEMITFVPLATCAPSTITFNPLGYRLGQVSG